MATGAGVLAAWRSAGAVGAIGDAWECLYAGRAAGWLSLTCGGKKGEKAVQECSMPLVLPWDAAGFHTPEAVGVAILPGRKAGPVWEFGCRAVNG